MPRVLLCGDVEGQLQLLSKLVEAVEKRSGPFDCLLCCGTFFTPLPNNSPAPNSDEPSITNSCEDHTANLINKIVDSCPELSAFIKQNTVFRIPIYFIDYNSNATSILRNATLPQSSYPLEIIPNLFYLGKHGVSNIHSLSVAFISGAMGSTTRENSNCSSTTNEDHTNHSHFYTDDEVQRLIGEHQSFKGKVDVLLTSEWPQQIFNCLNKEQLNEIEGLEIDTNSPINCSSAATELMKAFEPRYHFAALSNTFYQRPAFKSNTFGYATKFISLGKVGSKGSNRKSFHAIELQPIEQCHPDTLYSLTDPWTGNPFIETKRKHTYEVSNDAANNSKKSKHGNGENESFDKTHGEAPRRDSEVVCVSNIPFEIDETSLHKVLSSFGELKFIRLPKDETGKSIGKAWAVFKDAAAAQQAAAASEQIEAGKRKLRMFVWNGKIPYGQQNSSLKVSVDSTDVDTQPHNDCWFCLSNPSIAKQLLLDIGDSVYLSLPKGGITADHMLIIPIKHYPSYAHCTTGVREELNAFVRRIRTCYEREGQDLVVFERFLQMRNSKAMHTQLHVVPIQERLAYHSYELFKEHAEKDGLRFIPLPPSTEMPELQKLVAQYSNVSYIYLELPGDNTARGKQVLRLIGVPKSGGRMPMNFCRDVLCEILDIPKNKDWRECCISEKEEIALANKLKEKLGLKL